MSTAKMATPAATGDAAWALVGPWYRWSKPGLPAAGRLSAPALQKFAGDDFITAFMAHRRCLPEDILRVVETVPKGWDDETWKARSIADYIASMTDRMAVQEHRELYDITQVIR